MSINFLGILSFVNVSLITFFWLKVEISTLTFTHGLSYIASI